MRNKVHHLNFLDNSLPDKCANLIIADPPYFEVKGAFDFVWDSFEDYIEDVELWAKECKRILADNGTLFWWGHAKKIAYSQIVLDRYFNLENSMIWRKPDSIQYQYYSVELSRSFNTHNERLLMYSNDFEPGEWDKTGNEIILEKHIKPRHPFAIYLRGEFKRAGKEVREVRKFVVDVLGFDSAMINRWLDGDSIMKKEIYLKFRGYLNGEFLRKEYEELRRPFHNSMKLEDVLTFSQEGNISRNYDHDTVKPERLTRALINTCSRPGDLVVVPFAGSGTECAMAASEGREFIGFDVKKKYVDMANARAEKILKEPKLFYGNGEAKKEPRPEPKQLKIC